MTIGPTPPELLGRAQGDLRIGLPVVMYSGQDAVLVHAVETLRPERLAGLRGLGRPTIVLTSRRARTLKVRCYDGDLVRIVVPDAADLPWLQALANPAEDLATPMKGPFETCRGDGPVAVFRAALALAKSARLLPAVASVVVENGVEFVAAQGLTVISAESVVPLLGNASPLQLMTFAGIPLKSIGIGRLHVYRQVYGGEEHCAVEIGRPVRDLPVLTRLHSACFTGDVLGSLKCDCGPQLNAALGCMAVEGAGVLLYLSQEGRGIGLANKIRAYSLQDQGFDTVEANHRLGFEDDERDFRLGAEILGKLGFSEVRLMTNNPAKIEMLRNTGIAVTERVPLKVGATDCNRDYLEVKARKSGHLL